MLTAVPAELSCGVVVVTRCPEALVLFPELRAPDFVLQLVLSPERLTSPGLGPREGTGAGHTAGFVLGLSHLQESSAEESLELRPTAQRFLCWQGTGVWPPCSWHSCTCVGGSPPSGTGDDLALLGQQLVGGRGQPA